MRHSRGTRPRRLWVGAMLAPLMVGRWPAAAVLAAVLVLVLVVVAVALGSAFARSADRRRACLHTLQTLLRLAPWTCDGDRSATDGGSEIADTKLKNRADKVGAVHRPGLGRGPGTGREADLCTHLCTRRGGTC